MAATHCPCSPFPSEQKKRVSKLVYTNQKTIWNQEKCNSNIEPGKNFNVNLCHIFSHMLMFFWEHLFPFYHIYFAFFSICVCGLSCVVLCCACVCACMCACVYVYTYMFEVRREVPPCGGPFAATEIGAACQLPRGPRPLHQGGGGRGGVLPGEDAGASHAFLTDP